MLNEDVHAPHTVVTTAASNQSVTYKVLRSDGSTGDTSNGMSVMMTATGV